MENKTVDIMIYIKPSADQGQVASVVKRLAHTPGVIMSRVNSKIKRLINVTYDPDQLSSRAILQGVKQNISEASLVGM